MAWDINRIVINGRLAGDVEMRVTPSGSMVARFDFASEGRSTRNNEKNVSFFHVVAWNKNAELAEKYLKKGSPIIVDGYLQQRSWNTNNGERRSVVEIVVERIQFLGGNPQHQNNNPQSMQQQNTYQQEPQQDYYDTTEIEINKDDPFDDDAPF